MTSGAVAVAVILILGSLFLADVHSVRTASVEAAALGGICGGGYIALQDDSVHLDVGIGMGNSGEQSLCIRMEGL